MLTVRDLSIGYGSGDIVDGASFNLLEGSVTAIVGASGSGKSTLLYTLGLLKQPSKGSISVDQTRIDTLNDREMSRFRADNIGFVFQDALLDPNISVLENVLAGLAFVRRIGPSDAATAQQLVLALGVDVPLDRRPRHISGGQAQRIAVARASIAMPKILLADEPTGNLDSASRETVFGALMESARRTGAVVAIATHDDSLASRCDSILEVAGGSVRRR